MKQHNFVFLAAAAIAGVVVPNAAAQGVPPTAGSIAVSEIMFNPGVEACVTDNNGEYFEVTNISSVALNLNGIFVQDSALTTFFRTTATVATLPPLYPGQSFLFCRTPTFATNGNLSNVDYAYAASPVPADNATVGATAMNLNNSAPGDMIVISVGGPVTVPTPNPNGYVAGTVIETVSYNPAVAPFTSSGSGQGAERIDLFSPMVVSGTANSTNMAVSTQAQVSCGTNNWVGTPRERNSVDATVWPQNVPYDRTPANTGTLTFTGPASVGTGIANYKVTDGTPTLHGLSYYLGYSDNVPGDYPISLFIPGNPGSIVLDLVTAQYLPPNSFDGAGNGVGSVAVPPLPVLVGQTFQLQWLALDGTFTIVLSNGVKVTITE
jgi:hypothetical protein